VRVYHTGLLTARIDTSPAVDWSGQLGQLHAGAFSEALSQLIEFRRASTLFDGDI